MLVMSDPGQQVPSLADAAEHLDLAVRYRPAATDTLVGGDWCEAFLSPAGAVTVAVGDVTGHDRAAAAVAGELRRMLRDIVCSPDAGDPDGGDPAQVLTTLDRGLGTSAATPLATALVARIEAPGAAMRNGFRTLRWSNAGHPPPLLIERDGTTSVLERPSDLLLGVVPDAARQHHDVALRPGATVVLYTDGLIEHRDATLDDGLHRLVTAAPGLAALPVDDLCDQLLARVDPDLTDDIALLAVRVGAGS